jgi:hypothetical protein
MRYFKAVVLLVLVSLFLTACSNATPTEAPKQAVPITASVQETPTFSAGNATAATTADVPAYAGSKPLEIPLAAQQKLITYTGNPKIKDGKYLAFITDDTPDKVIEFYRKHWLAKAFTETLSISTGGFVLASRQELEKDQQKVAILAIGKLDKFLTGSLPKEHTDLAGKIKEGDTLVVVALGNR